MPDFKGEICASIANLNLTPERELEIVEELSQHLEEVYEQAVWTGASEKEAKQIALEQLQETRSLADKVEVAERRPSRRAQAMGVGRSKPARLAGVLEDLRFGLRMLAKNPAFAAVAIITLAIGIGASAAMLSVVRDVIIRPLPYVHADRLYAVWADADSLGQKQIAASGPDFVDYLEQNKSFARMAEFLPRFTFNWTGDEEPQLVNCTGVSQDFFATLGVEPYLGHLYQPQEYTYFKNDTMVVSYNFWKKQLGGDPHVIGRVLRLQGENPTIIGVLPPMSDLFPDTDVWPKLTIHPSYPFMQWRGNKFLSVVAELKPGITRKMAEEDLTNILRRVPEEPRDVRVRLVPLKDELVGNVRLPLLATLTAAILILVVACMNVAALLLARAVKRQGEIAVRLSLGAGLARITQQLIAEALLLSAFGSVLGLLLAFTWLRILAQIPNLPLPRLDGVHLNWPAVMIIAAICIVTALVFGWIPSLKYARLDLASALTSRTVAIGRTWSLSALVVAEIACSIVLTVSVGLLVHSFWQVMHVDPGFQSQSVSRVYLRSESPPNTGPELSIYAAKAIPFWNDVLQEAASIPGVGSAALADWRPGRDAATATIAFEGRPNDPTYLPSVDSSWISADFFQTVGARWISGRAFTEHDNANSPAVVVINAEAARRFWPEQNPIGRRIAVSYTGPGRRIDDTPPRLREIVGVVANIKHGPLDSRTAPAVYLPYLQDETFHDMSALSLFVRSEGDPIGLSNALRNRIHAIKPDQPVPEIQSLEQLIKRSVAPRRYTLVLLGAFAVVALVLSAVGLYGVISYATSQRTREFGVRIALGATRGRVILNVLHRAATLTVLGAVIGIGVALVVTRSLSALLFQVSSLDFASFSAAVAVLAAISICSCLLPAWRASRTDPMIALRTE